MELDRISMLPDDILITILSKFNMFTKHVVQTSILSNRWRHLWKFNPSLTFYVMGDRSTTSLQTQEQQVRNIHHYLDNFIPTTLQKFEIFLCLADDFYSDVERWISFAVTRGVRELLIKGIVEQGLIHLPRDLFFCNSLWSLALWNSNFEPPPNFNGFSNLRLLKLDSVAVTDQTLHKLLFTSPSLESLTLSRCLELKNLNIRTSVSRLHKLIVKDCAFLEKLVTDAQNVRLFEYQGSHIKLCLANAPHLLRSVLYIDVAAKVTVVQEWRLLVTKIAEVKFLKVNSWFFEFIFSEYYINKIPRTLFMNLKKFCWSGHLLSRKVVLAIATFLGDCPLLENVCIFLDQNSSCANYWIRRPNLFVEKWIPHSKIVCGVYGNENCSQPRERKQYLEHFEYSFHHLKIIDMVGFSGKKKEMDLVKFLLNKSIVLDLFQLTPLGEENQLPKSVLQERLSRLPKASLSAKVVLSDIPSVDFMEV